jgi:hypothetical protein
MNGIFSPAARAGSLCGPAMEKPTMSKMRAKLRLNYVKEVEWDGKKQQEVLTFNAVAASKYPEDGSDENNTFAKWSPSAEFEIRVANPALWGQFKVTEEYYVDFTPAA